VAIFKWRALSGAFGIGANWANATFRVNPARVPPGARDTVSFDVGGGAIGGTGSVAQLNIAAAVNPWTLAGQFAAGAAFVDEPTVIAATESLTAGALTVGIVGALSAAAGGSMRATSLTMAGGSTLAMANTGIAVVGAGAWTVTDGASQETILFNGAPPSLLAADFLFH
jgi:hypothetical protein